MPAGPTRKQLEAELKAAEKTSDQLNVLLNLAKKGSDRFRDLSKRIFEVNSGIRDMTKGLEIFDKKTEAINDFTADIKKANKELGALGDTTETFGIDLASSLAWDSNVFNSLLFALFCSITAARSSSDS